MSTELLSAIATRLDNYKGKTIAELFVEFNLASLAKSKFEMLVSKMLMMDGKLNSKAIFKRNNIIFKTIRKNEKGKVVESMSLPFFKFADIYSLSWNQSPLFKLFSENTFAFMVFKNTKDGYIFEKYLFWKAEQSLIDGPLFDVWNQTKEAITAGNIVKEIQNKGNKTVLKTNFPGMAFNGVCHVRPHARNSRDTDKLPISDKMTGLTDFTKQCFWLNNSFVGKLVG